LIPPNGNLFKISASLKIATSNGHLWILDMTTCEGNVFEGLVGDESNSMKHLADIKMKIITTTNHPGKREFSHSPL
jgi:hypothetical protein